ncbi:hypothetical protein FXO37_18498 [Capsicum annuum]|nr:hypothetical protein FXO37_18498 [Capsicum annuum]
MRSINLSKLCMEEDDFALNQEVQCNHGFVVPSKTSWTSTNPVEVIGLSLRSCNFLYWRDKENTASRSKFVIPKLIEKLGEHENLVKPSQYNKFTSFNEVKKLIAETSKEVDKPRVSKEDNNCVDLKLKKLKEEIEKMKKERRSGEVTWLEERLRIMHSFSLCFVVVLLL